MFDSIFAAPQVWSKYLSANGVSKHCSNFRNLAKSYGLSGVVCWNLQECDKPIPQTMRQLQKRCPKINLKLNFIMFWSNQGLDCFKRIWLFHDMQNANVKLHLA